MPIDNGDGTFDYTAETQAEQTYGMDGYAQPTAQPSDSQNFDIGAVVMSATAVLAPNHQQYDDQMRSVETTARESGGVAPGLGSNWITETLGGAAKWYEKQDKETKGTLLSLAGSFVKGMFSHGTDERKLKSSEKIADATMLNAQTNADATNKKFDNASAIGKTTFGAPQGLMTYSDKLASRRARNQYKV